MQVRLAFFALGHQFAGNAVVFTAAGDERELAFGFFAERDAETRRGRRQHPTVAHFKGALDDGLRMQRSPRRRNFQYGGVRTGKTAVEVLHEDATGTPGVGGDLAVAIGEAPGDGHELAYTSHEAGVGLADVEAVAFDENAPLVIGGQAFAAGNRHTGGGAQFGVAPRIGVVQRLFEKKQPVWLASPGHLDGGRGVPGVSRTVAHVAIEHKLEVASAVLADEVEFRRFEVGGFRRVAGDLRAIFV